MSYGLKVSFGRLVNRDRSIPEEPRDEVEDELYIYGTSYFINKKCIAKFKLSDSLTNCNEVQNLTKK